MPVRQGIVLTLKSTREGKKWVCVCEEIGTSTFGRDLDDAVRRLVEMTIDHLKALHDVGELDRFFRTHRIRVIDLTGQPTTKKIQITPARVKKGDRCDVPAEALTFASSVSVPRSCFI